MEKSRFQETKQSPSIDGATIKRLDEVLYIALRNGANITPEAADSMYDDYFANRAIIKDKRKFVPINTDEYIEASFNAQTVIMDKLRAGLYPVPRPEEKKSILMDESRLQREQVEAAFKAVRQEAKRSVISRSIVTAFR